jgi:hypothetical protein
VTVLIALLIVSIFTLDYLAVKLEVISRFATLVPDIIAMFIALIIVGRILVTRQWEQPKDYLWLIVAFIFICLIGIVAESVAPGVIVSGIRNYFKFIPLLFLPAVYSFTDRQKHIVIGTFLFVACVQVPLAFFQRFVQFAHRMHTGDPVTGTVSTSSSLTLILCVAIALVITLYLHRKMGLMVTLILFAFLAAPTALNETKAIILLLPVATLLPFVLASGVEDKWRRLMPVLGLCVAGIVAVGITYNLLSEYRWWQERNIFEFLTSGEFSGYLYRGAEAGGGSSQLIGRLDSIILPFQVLGENWMQMLFGVGIGNATPAFIDQLSGAYAVEFAYYGFNVTSIGNILWEVGIAGLLFYVILLLFVFRDARRWSKGGEKESWIGTWWAVSIWILLPALAYKPILIFNETASLLFFWSGLCAAEAWRMKNRKSVTSAPERPILVLAGQESSVAGISAGGSLQRV